MHVLFPLAVVLWSWRTEAISIVVFVWMSWSSYA